MRLTIIAVQKTEYVKYCAIIIVEFILLKVLRFFGMIADAW